MLNTQDITVKVIPELMGHTIVDVHATEDVIIFKRDDGNVVYMYHPQDCCESVTVEDIDGDIGDLIGTVVEAEEVTHDGFDDDGDTSFTWTYYKIATNNGFVNIRWYGVSNGYYSESVYVRLINMKRDVDIRTYDFDLY